MQHWISKKPNNPWTIHIYFALILCVGSASHGEETKTPEELREARKNYEEEFFGKIDPIQEKYRGALRNFQRAFTRQGDLDAATEAKQELERLDRWETIPSKPSDRTFNSPQLNSLLKSYERAALEVINPIVVRYSENLARIKGAFVNAGNLDAALVLDKEIENVRSGKSLPSEIAKKRYLASFSRRDFAEWILDQIFEFSGNVAGKTELDFDEDKVDWGNGQFEYDYEVTEDRAIEISKGAGFKSFRIRFSKDLQSALFESDQGVYPLLINGDEPFDFESLVKESGLEPPR